MSAHPTPPREAEGSSSTRATLRLGRLLRVYHRHQLLGIDNLRRALRSERPVLLIGNHCMDLVDPLMLRAAVQGRAPKRLCGCGDESRIG
jgi:1-acyl-sn-glycerol-3-phosphate acyltransferase